MAASQVSRRRRSDQLGANGETTPESRAQRNRLRREQAMEKRFNWLFILVVGAVTLYLLSRTSWGLALIHHFFQNPPFQS